ncbi:hypothetical protein B0T26DRAFT_745255 [Lasiosphaeria miniovina]|uniref:Uncharacterized protein n=1 Tax=Lasiosphaeria miniovina TaxID=1954250 RepID=A0AA40BFB6_9PEZI|nr:uncharacterized protein B0T26DRAFT_745255 [Lasiosphaeria miniovina]KAK0733180.1 hypothetical protein B0T26DRAFT_745255 [Lasiosphaeria miniovina]
MGGKVIALLHSGNGAGAAAILSRQTLFLNTATSEVSFARSTIDPYSIGTLGYIATACLHGLAALREDEREEADVSAAAGPYRLTALHCAEDMFHYSAIAMHPAAFGNPDSVEAARARIQDNAARVVDRLTRSGAMFDRPDAPGE